MYKECGDTIDIWKKYITQSRKLFNNSKYASREDCIREHLNQAMLKTIPNCDHCNRACEESLYTVNAPPCTGAGYLAGWNFSFVNKGTVDFVKVTPDYTLEQFVGALGGVLGLGGKFMACLQLLIFSLLQSCTYIEDNNFYILSVDV